MKLFRRRSPVSAALKTATGVATALAVLLGTRAAMAQSPFVLLDPKGPVGADEKWIILLALGLMLIVVVPVIGMTIFFAWRYRASNTRATFAPDWAHSYRIEAVMWLVPCAIVAVLAYVAWTTSHTLDPYRPLVSEQKPLKVQVVSLDWKWLFIYPEQGIATVNELAFPAGRPVHFQLTSGSVMNSFFIPQLGSQIYTMAGMQTKLSLLADAPGHYLGLSANYSGGGFSDMTFDAHAMPPEAFDAWVAKVRRSANALTPAAYRRLEKPSSDVPPMYFGSVGPAIYHDALNLCADGGTCMDARMRHEMHRKMSDGPARMSLADPALRRAGDKPARVD
jgi:cytochrome o ubiquinol oxidase subunit 2